MVGLEVEEWRGRREEESAEHSTLGSNTREIFGLYFLVYYEKVKSNGTKRFFVTFLVDQFVIYSSL